jgi:hypothetical protein
MSDQAENTAPVEKTEVDSKVEATSGEGSAPSGTEAPASGDDTSTWTEKAQKRFDQLTREKYEGLSRAERAEYRAQMLEQQLAEREEAAAKTSTVAPLDDYPTLESVGWDEAGHAVAVRKWIDSQARNTVKTVLSEERTAAEREQFERNWERTQDDFIKSKPDYAQKVGSLPESLMTRALAAEIKEMGNPEVAYYLAENVEKLAEIARLPVKAMARELGRIEARMEAAKAAPPPVSKAPPPTSKIDASESAGDKDPIQMSDVEFAKWRKRQISQRGSR